MSIQPCPHLDHTSLDGWTCAEDGGPCHPHTDEARPSSLCPRFVPSQAICPVCGVEDSDGSEASFMLTDTYPHDGKSSYACPACGYLACPARYAGDMVEALDNADSPLSKDLALQS